MSSKLALFLISISYTFFCSATDAEVIGNAPEWKGLKVRLLIETDPYSKNETVIDTATISEEGYFKLSASLEQPVRAWLVVNRFRAPIYLSSQTHLEVRLIEDPKNQLITTWQNGSFEYSIENPDTSNVNILVAEFDRDYYQFFLRNATLLGTSSIKKKIEEFDSTHSAQGNEFINNYINYSIAEMKLSNGFPRTQVFEDYLDSSKIELHNPAWVSLHQTFFADYFESYDKRFKGAALYNRMTEGISPIQLDSLLSLDPFLSDSNMRQITALHAVSEVVGNGKYPQNILKTLLAFYQSESQNNKIRLTAENLLKKLDTQSVSPSILPFLPASARDSFSEEDDKPFVIMITKPNNKADKKEKVLAGNLIDKYSDTFRIMELSIEKSNTQELWQTFSLNDPYEILNALDIYAFPHYLWVSPKGVVLENPVERPSQGLEVKLYKIQMEAKKANQIKVGQ